MIEAAVPHLLSGKPWESWVEEGESSGKTGRSLSESEQRAYIGHSRDISSPWKSPQGMVIRRGVEIQ